MYATKRESEYTGARRWIARVAVIVTVVAASVLLPPKALADSAADLRTAIASARGGSCTPLRSDPIVERVAEVTNRAVVNYQNLTSAGAQPIDNPAPGLKALGYGGSRSKLLRGYAKTEANAIKALILESLAVESGPPRIADCSFKDYGASVIHDESWGYFTSAVLAGP